MFRYDYVLMGYDTFKYNYVDLMGYDLFICNYFDLTGAVCLGTVMVV